MENHHKTRGRAIHKRAEKNEWQHLGSGSKRLKGEAAKMQWKMADQQAISAVGAVKQTLSCLALS